MTERTVEQAKADCIAAWAAHPEATHGWCVHHEVEMEELTEPIENRIRYIVENKAEEEIVTRLDNLRPVLSKVPILTQKAYDEATAPAWKAYREATAPAWKAYDEATAPAWKAYREAIAPAEKAYGKAIAPARKAYGEAIAAAHKQDVPDHTWDGKTIFPK